MSQKTLTGKTVQVWRIRSSLIRETRRCEHRKYTDNREKRKRCPHRAKFVVEHDGFRFLCGIHCDTDVPVDGRWKNRREELDDER